MGKIENSLKQAFEKNEKQLLAMNPNLSSWVREAILTTLDMVKYGVDDELIDSLPLNEEDRQQVTCQLRAYENFLLSRNKSNN